MLQRQFLSVLLVFYIGFQVPKQNDVQTGLIQLYLRLPGTGLQNNKENLITTMNGKEVQICGYLMGELVEISACAVIRHYLTTNKG
jgi:hypothetical protein